MHPLPEFHRLRRPHGHGAEVAVALDEAKLTEEMLPHLRAGSAGCEILKPPAGMGFGVGWDLGVGWGSAVVWWH